MTDKNPPEVQTYAPRRERVPMPIVDPIPVPLTGQALRDADDAAYRARHGTSTQNLKQGDASDLLAAVVEHSIKYPEKGTKVPPAEAQKNDAGKGGFEFLPMDALQSINEVLRFGAKKYAPHNWEKGFAWTRLGNAIIRHVFAWLSGEQLDPETKLPHLAHAGCMVLFALSHQLRGIGENDIHPSQTANRGE